MAFCVSITIGSMSGASQEQPPSNADARHAPSRVRRGVEAVKQRAGSIRDDLERRRADVPVIDVVFRGAEHDARTGGGILAGAVAFRVFLFVVPYVFVVVFAFGVGADAADKDPVDLARNSGIVGLASSAIQASADVSTFARVVTLTLALWALLSGSRTLVKSLYTVHALIWGVPRVKVKRLMLQAVLAIVAATGLIVLVRLIAELEDISHRAVDRCRWRCSSSCPVRCGCGCRPASSRRRLAPPGATCCPARSCSGSACRCSTS